MIIFGVIGGLVAGRWGFFFGIVLAVIVSQSQKQRPAGSGRRHRASSAPAADKVAEVFFYSFFSCAAKMAKADGRVTSAEIAAVERFMSAMGVAGNARKAAVEIFRAGKEEAKPAQAYVQELVRVCGRDREMGMLFLQGLADIATADGHVKPAEREILKAVAAGFAFPPGTVDRLVGVTSPGGPSKLEAYYALLDCTPTMSDDQIKKQYRLKCMEYHPDKIQAKGVPEEFVELANEKVKQFNEAYEAIRRARA